MTAVAIIIPQIALASWWDPFSWGIFNRQKEVKVEQSSNTNIDSQKITSTLADTKILQQKEVSSNMTTNPTVISPTKKQAVVLDQKINELTQEASTKKDSVKISTVVCQGTTRMACPMGQNFVCESNGNYYCETASVKPIQPYQTYTMPNGAVVDTNGSIVKPAPQVSQKIEIMDTKQAKSDALMAEYIAKKKCT